MSDQKYILLTAARNEEGYIENTLRSVIEQTVLPLAWIIVSNGSTDATEDIVTRYSEQHSFIQLLSLPDSEIPDFSQKVKALQYGYSYNSIHGLDFDYIGILDADVSFEPAYFEKLFDVFEQDEDLGITGGIIYEQEKGQFVNRYGNSDDYVAGAIQLFKRSCFDEIGGYRPLPYAHEDTVATEMAIMAGYKVKPVHSLPVMHHRRSNSARVSMLRARFRHGIADYMIGYHPFFEAVKIVRRISERPYFFSALFRMCGFIWANIKQSQRPVSVDFIKHLRNRQMSRLQSGFGL